MASGRNHDRSIVLGFLASIPIAITEHQLIPVSISYLSGGLYLSPDLDLRQSYPTKRWGLLRWIWVPYRKLICGGKHRCKLSHSPLIGTIVRVAYLAAWLAIADRMFFSAVKPGWESAFRSTVAEYFLPQIPYLLVGAEISAIVHLFLDGMIIPLPKSIYKKLQGK